MMTEGQQRAVRELQRLSTAKPNTIELIGEPFVDDSYWLTVRVSMSNAKITNNGMGW